uniref:Aspartic peptidase DDI1-type domain-containing protein n=1 Tax=Nicotiana tabacum TaxID=4097 RepID=A0A1S4A5W3_TOBAC
MPALPFPQKIKREKLDKCFGRFLDMLKKLYMNIPFTEALTQMPTYAKFMKEIMSSKRKLEETTMVKLNAHCSAILQNKIPQKCGDPRSFTIPCSLGSEKFDKALCDSGASINLMPLSVFRKLEGELGVIKLILVSLQLADQTTILPEGIIEDILVRVDKLVFPVDFIVVDMEVNKEVPLILRRLFLSTGRAILDIYEGQLMLRVGNEKV